MEDRFLFIILLFFMHVLKRLVLVLIFFDNIKHIELFLVYTKLNVPDVQTAQECSAYIHIIFKC